METFKNVLFKILSVILLIIWSYITFSSIFKIYDSDYVNLNELIILIGSLVMLTSITLFYKYISKKEEKVHNKICILIFIFSFTLMLYIGYTCKIIPTYDLSHITYQVKVMIENGKNLFGTNTYFLIHPHQIPIALFVYAIESLNFIFNIADPTNIIIFYNGFMTSITFVFVYLILKKLTDSKIAIIGMLLMALIPDFYLSASYYYTDILSMPFSVIGLYFLIVASKEEDKVKKIIKYLISGLLFAIGFKIRAVSVIVLIAYIIDLFCKQRVKIAIKSTLNIILPMVFVFIIYSMMILPIFKIEIDDNNKLSAIHYIMMGFNKETDGGYSVEDYNFTVNSENKIEDNFNKIIERIGKVDDTFIQNKLRRVWSSGNHDISRKYRNLEEYSPLYEIIYGNKRNFLRYFSQIVQVTIYLLFLFFIFKHLRTKAKYHDNNDSMILLTIFGAITFYLIWEALSRYSLSFLPFIILGASQVVPLLDNFISKKNIKIDKETINFQKVKKYVFISTIIMTVIFLCFGYIKYTQTIQNVPYARLTQHSYNDSMVPIIDNKIKQTFRVSDSFNTIEFMFDGENNSKNIKYIFEVYNNKNELIRDGAFSSFGATKNKYRVITFDTVEVKEKSEFYILIYSKYATLDNYLSIVGVNQLPENMSITNSESKLSIMDFNLNGETYSDLEKLDFDLRLRVLYIDKGTIMNSFSFILFGLIVLGIELLIYYKYVLVNNSKNKRRKIVKANK